jgi:hypothetical protein
LGKVVSMALEKGFVEKWPDRGPPRSSAGFAWPNTRQATDEQRLALRKFLTTQLRARGMNHRDFATAFLGQVKTAAGSIVPRGGNMVLEYLDGGAWPNEQRARQFGAFFKVPMEAMLMDDGKPLEPIPLVRLSRATAKSKWGRVQWPCSGARFAQWQRPRVAAERTCAAGTTASGREARRAARGSLRGCA